MPNEKKIKARIYECGLTIQAIAAEMGLSPYTLGQKISGKAQMTLKEARYLQRKLEIPDSEVTLYFFTNQVA
ncbi:MAG: helix-turn-helix transcriptional regulator [Ruminococcaceae bacterium]|nr:helix-turn-helix transcriptional regulator [Oscillospiraceae bacterium]